MFRKEFPLTFFHRVVQTMANMAIDLILVNALVVCQAL
jgi:hypothetical protein